jgi:aminoglycoside 6'-N-acetyltransferase I
MTAEVSVRKLDAGDDLASAIRLLQAFFREEGFDTSSDRISENTKRMAALETCAIFLAEHDTEAIAVATLSMEFGIEYGWSAEMGDLYVVPGWRGKGIARMLIETADAYVRQRGAAGYQVTVTPYAATEHDLAKFYAKIGFESEGRIILWRSISST